MAIAQVPRSRLPAPEVNVRNALNAFKAALEAHKTTVGVPAPLPLYDICYALVRFDDFTVVDDPVVPGSPDSFKDAIERMVDKVNKVQDEIVKLRAENEARDREINRLQARLQSLESRG